ncbi:MICAL-like [Drosophila busckii]|uniref:MICAL-like n=1 Tax=Drosophila busckii TaxID=30019 RepID=A0A0M4EK62_DROBS|nr:MICAL-like protein 1 [Drosophila busckii]ALC49716.1 MICAL-like [Drosophila busckii]
MTELRGTKALEMWCRRVTKGYNNVNIENMTTSWRDGLGFCAIIHHFRPDLIDFDKLQSSDIYHNNDLAFTTAEKYLSIPALLDAADMAAYTVPDRLSILTYLSQLYQAFSHARVPDVDKTKLKRDFHESNEQSHTSDIKIKPEINQLKRNCCHECMLPVYLTERIFVDKQVYHRNCLKCKHCSAQLTIDNIIRSDDQNMYCSKKCSQATMGGLSFNYSDDEAALKDVMHTKSIDEPNDQNAITYTDMPEIQSHTTIKESPTEETVVHTKESRHIAHLNVQLVRQASPVIFEHKKYSEIDGNYEGKEELTETEAPHNTAVDLPTEETTAEIEDAVQLEAEIPQQSPTLESSSHINITLHQVTDDDLIEATKEQQDDELKPVFDTSIKTEDNLTLVPETTPHEMKAEDQIDIKVEDTPSKIKAKDNLNPFDSSDDEVELEKPDNDKSVSKSSETIDVRHKREQEVSKNPFEMDDDDEQSPHKKHVYKRNKKPAPAPPKSAQKETQLENDTTSSKSASLERESARSAIEQIPTLPAVERPPRGQKLVPLDKKLLSDMNLEHSTTNIPLHHSYINERQTYKSSNEKLSQPKWAHRKGPAPPIPISTRSKLDSINLQGIGHELNIIEVQQQGLEKQGVILEKMIRERCEANSESMHLNPTKLKVSSAKNTKEVEDLILQLFELVNEKNELFRRQAELVHLRKLHRLEQEQTNIEQQLRTLISQPDHNKTDSDKAQEESLISRLITLVDLRNNVIDCLEIDRIREAKEDMSIKQTLAEYNAERVPPPQASKFKLSKKVKLLKRDKNKS